MSAFKKETKQQTRRAWVWIMLMVDIVFVLLLMTLGIIALRVGNYLPEGTDTIFVVGKNPSVEVGDHEGQVWESGKKVNIFKAQYANGEDVVTVLSQDGSKLIAPGTTTMYRFNMYNNGNMAVVYQADIDFDLKIGDKKQTDFNFPLQVRLKTKSQGYLIGDESTWVPVDKAVISNHVSVLGASSYEQFDLELQWLFDGGTDELDTMLGNQSVEQGVSLTLGIDTYAEQHLDSTAQGGTKIDAESGSQEFGGTVRWLWMTLLFINTAVLIFYIAWLLNKRLQKW